MHLFPRHTTRRSLARPTLTFVAAVGVAMSMTAPSTAQSPARPGADTPSKAHKTAKKVDDSAADPADDSATEVDWRGLHRMDENGHSIKREPPPPSPIRELAQSAPYRVHIASTDGKKLTITDAYTLERWRIFAAGRIRGFDFSGGGYYLYVVADDGQLTSIVVSSGNAQPMAKLAIAPDEAVIDVLGHGSQGHRFVTVVVGKGPPPTLGQPCARHTRIRRLRVRQKSSWPEAKVIVEQGMHDLRRRGRRKGTSPNTRYEVLLRSDLMLNNKIGGGSVGKLNRARLPRGVVGFHWMRDSRGVVVKATASAANGCKHRLTVASFRQPPGQRKAWHRQRNWPSWRAPADVDLVLGAYPHEDLQWTPDDMRLVAVVGGYVALVEPLPRHRGHVAVVAPPTTLWPKVRPGVRGLASGTGVLRHAEILAEQGDLDSANEQLALALKRIAPKPAPADVARLRKRIRKLAEIRARRAVEFGVAEASLRGDRQLPVDAGPDRAVDDVQSPR